MLSLWNDKKYIEYLDLFQKYITIDPNVVHLSGKPFKTTKNGVMYQVTPPTFIDIDEEIYNIEHLLTAQSNQSKVQMFINGSSGISLENYQRLNELRLYKAQIRKLMNDKISDFRKDQIAVSKACQKLQDIDVQSKPGEHNRLVKQIISMTHDLLKKSENVPSLFDQPRVYAIKTLPIIEESNEKAPEVKAKVKKQSDSGVQKAAKAINKAEKDVLDQIERVKERVLTQLTPFRIFHQKFQTPEQCKSQARSQKYYVSKVDLMEMIKSKDKLRPKFPSINKMSKEDICERLFELSNNQE